MTNDEARAFFTRFLEVWKRESVGEILEFYAEDARIDSPMFHTVTGRTDIQKSFTDLFRAFDDWVFRIDDVVADSGAEDRAVLFYTGQQTHRGDLFGMPGTGRRVEVNGALLMRFENGRITSERRLYDFTGLLVQLGVLKAKAV
jgi:steroid delta-isomerase-like uncharacterized protein